MSQQENKRIDTLNKDTAVSMGYNKVKGGKPTQSFILIGFRNERGQIAKFEFFRSMEEVRNRLILNLKDIEGARKDSNDQEKVQLKAMENNIKECDVVTLKGKNGNWKITKLTTVKELLKGDNNGN